MQPPAKPESWKIVLVSLLVLGAVSYVDFVTGDEVLFFVFYFAPVALCGWHLQRLATFAMAVLSGVIWFFVDLISGHHYSHEALRYWNAFTCFVAFAIIGLGLHHIRRGRDTEQQARLELEKVLAELRTTNEQIRVLQDQLQVVCAWTKRIRLEGKWLTLEEFLTNKLNIKISHGISPDAFTRIKEELDRPA
jgi:hypothetical protein